MRTSLVIPFLVISLLAQGCVALTGVKRSDLSQVKPGATKEDIQDALGEPIEIAEMNLGPVAVYKYSGGMESLLEMEGDGFGYIMFMPYLWPLVEYYAREEKKSQERFVTIVFNKQAQVSYMAPGNQLSTFQSAEQGDSEAQYQLGLTLGGGPNAWKWYCLAAHHGHAGARYVVGGYYRLGKSPVGEDAVRSYVWFSLADDFATAAYWKEMQATTLTEQQIVEGDRLTAEWQPNPAECELEPAPAGT